MRNFGSGVSGIETFLLSKRLACFVSVKPRASFHTITVNGKGVVESIEHVAKSGARMNGGFFVFRREVFDYIEEGEELVEEPFRRLIGKKQLISYAHNGFWACMDTFKELQELEDLHGRGSAPWTVWNDGGKDIGVIRPLCSGGRIAGSSGPGQRQHSGEDGLIPVRVPGS